MLVSLYQHRLFLKTFISIRYAAEDGHGDGLGFVGEGGEDYAGFERDSVDGLEGEGYYEVKGSETAWYGYEPAEASCK